MKKNLLLLTMSVAILVNPLITSAAMISPVTATPVTANPSEVLKKAIADYKHLSRSERKSKIKDVKKVIHDYKAAKKANIAAPTTNTLLLVILAIILPPLAVYLHEGEINNKFWLDLILTLLLFLPGVIYALIVVLGKD